jgi:hypothetical protein
MERLSITHGMKVVGPTGKKLGHVTLCGDQHFGVRHHGHDRAATYDAIASLAGGVVHLKSDDLLSPEQSDLISGPRTTVKPIGFLDAHAP